MKFLKIVFAAAMLLVLWSPAQKAEAKPHFSFGFYGPGVGIHIGRYPYYHYPYYYRPYYYSYRRYYYRPRTYRRSYSGRCGYWSRRCAANWGYRNRNYYGCMRYHRCR